MRWGWQLAALAAFVLVVGCGDVPESASSSGSAAQGLAPPAPAPPGNPNGGASSSVAADDGGQMPVEESPAEEVPAEDGAAGDATSDVPSEAEGTTTPAGVGVGAKGQNYGGPGFVTTPIEAYFRTGERIAFEIQIPSAMKLYKASHDNKGPKSHEEFMRVIVQENGISLPELREGEEFLYDPKTEQLLVRHPEK